MKRKKPVRQAVLDAAVDLVESSGSGLLTLDAVAARAGVSKGGLLHHFNSKEALLTAMIARLAESFEAERSAAMERLSANAADPVEHEVELIETYLDRAFDGLGTRNQSAMPLFAVAAHQPALLQPIRDYFAKRSADTVAHFGNPTAILALSLLADGLWLFDALGIPPVTGKLREQVHQAVRTWARQVIESGGDDPVTGASRKTPRRAGPKRAGSRPVRAKSTKARRVP